MRHVLFALALIIGFSVQTIASEAQVRQLPSDAYGRLRNVEGLDISPDGTHLAMIAGNTKEERSILIVNVDTGNVVRIPSGEERAVDVSWLSNERFAAYFYKYTAAVGGAVRYNRARMIVMDRDGSDRVEINPPAGIADYLLDDPDHVLMVAGNQRMERTRSGPEMIQKSDVYKVNIKTGKGRPVQIGSDNTIDWEISQSGEARIRVDGLGETVRAGSARGTFFGKDYDRFIYYARPPGSNSWTKILEREPIDDELQQARNQFSIQGFNEDETKAYLVGRLNGENFASLYELDLATGDIEGPVFTPEGGYDLGGMLREKYSRRIVGYAWAEDKTQYEIWDEDLKRIYEAVRGAFPDSEISEIVASADRRRWVMRIQGGTVVDNYYMLEPAANRLQLIARSYPEIPDTAANPVRWITYKSRDGLDIKAYLTLPKGRDPEGLPTIMLPHGGPEARDLPGFDWWSQFLAHRGYAVLQPQFRHSSGFGRNWVEIGYGKWGREMNDDLSDGVKHLVDQGISDADKVCIFGWSYGGYAALAGATISPELYRCSVGGAPVSDFIEMINWSERVRGGANSPTVQYWNRAIGRRYANRDGLKEVSPARLVDNVRAPIMLIHGDIDLIVPISQSEIMASALEDAGKPYEFITLKGENHNLLRGETRMKMLQELDRFLKEHNPAQ